jgi:hypothetical protein
VVGSVVAFDYRAAMRQESDIFDQEFSDVTRRKREALRHQRPGCGEQETQGREKHADCTNSSQHGSLWGEITNGKERSDDQLTGSDHCAKCLQTDQMVGPRDERAVYQEALNTLFFVIGVF